MAGGGKSHCLLTKYLPNKLNEGVGSSEFQAIIFRKTNPELTIPGGIVDSSQSIYKQFGGVYGSQAKRWNFPSGSTVSFKAFPTGNYENLQSMQVSAVMIDEAAAGGWTQDEVLFLLTRMRSTTYGGKGQLTMTCNPNVNSFLYEWVKPFLDEEGVPREGTADIVRWFVNKNGEMYWGESKQELLDKFADVTDAKNPCIPMSFRFIPLGIYDNKVLMKTNPQYLAKLLAQKPAEQLRYLRGAWLPELNSGFFRREWCTIVDHPPAEPTSIVRSYDFAYSDSKAADYTCGVKISRDKAGFYYVEDVVRFKKLTDGVLREVISIAQDDGFGTKVTIPSDLGGGKAASVFFQKQLAEAGVPVRLIQISGARSKLQRGLPFCSIAEAGFVRIVRGDWNKDFFDEMENFLPNCRSQKDDQWDAVSDGFNTLAKQLQLPTFSIPDLSRASLSSRCS